MSTTTLAEITPVEAAHIPVPIEDNTANQHEVDQGKITTPGLDQSAQTRSLEHTLEPMEVSEDPEQAPESEPEYPTGFKFIALMLCIASILIVGGLDTTIVPTAVPAITDHFHTVADVGWYSAAFRLVRCSFSFMFGKLYKVYSIKRIFLASIAIFSVGTVICASAATSKLFVLGRAVSGLGFAGCIGGCFVVVVYALPLRKRPLYMSLLSGIESCAEITAPILGGVITEKLGWRWCFWVTVPLSVLTLLLVVFTFEDPQRSAMETLSAKEKFAQLDLLGNLFFLPSMTMLFIALSWAGVKYAWNSPVVIGMLCGFTVLLAAFAYMQYRRGDAATLPPRVLKQRAVLAGFAFSSCCASSISVIEYYMPTYFQSVKEFSPAKSGYMMLPIAIGFLVACLMQGSGTTLIGYCQPFMLTASLLLPISSGLLTTWSVNSGLAKLIIYPAMVGFAAGIGYQAPQTAVQTALSTADAPIGLSIIIFAQGFGPALMVSIAQTIFTSQLSTNLHEIAPSLDAKTIENMGLSDLKELLGKDRLQEVLSGFDLSLTQTWYLAVALCCATIIGSATMEWKSVKQKRS